MILAYEAVDRNGKNVRSTIEADSTQEACSQLRGQGMYVTSVSETKRAAAEAARPAKTSSRLPARTLTMFTRQMAMLLRAGSGIVPALSALRREMKKPQQRAVLEDIIDDLEEGAPLTDALRKHPSTFNSVYCAIVAAGEASATLTDMFDRLAVIVGKRLALRNKLIGALAYPALLVFLCCGIVNSLMFFVIPRFADMFHQLGVEVPATTRVLLQAGAFMQSYWPGILVGAGGIVTLLVALARDRRGKQWVADMQLRIPVVGTVMRRLIEAQILRTMGMLLEARVGVLETIDLARGVTSNARFCRLFDDLENVITTGGKLSTAFEHSGLIESYVCQAIRTGEESGSLGGAISYCADILDEGNTEMVNAATKLIEPVILMGMGSVVGTVAVSLFMPLFDLTSAMN